MEHDEIFYFNENLINCMNNICKMPITLISAPVGYGKTTALREFFRRTNTNYRVVAMERDCPVEVFWDSLRDALASCADGGRGGAEAFGLPLEFPMTNGAVSETVTRISRLNFSRKTVLIFDDFHNMKPPGPADFLVLLAKRAVRNLHVVVSSRHEFPNMRDLLLAGCSNIITAKAFVLSEGEISKFFAAHNVELSSRQARALSLYAEGWPSLVHNIMISVTLAGKIDGQSISAFENNIVLSLTEEVYIPLPDECKDLLLRLCGETDFTGEQADFVCRGETPDFARGALDKIKSRGAFVIREDTNGGSNRIHNFFAKAIKSRFLLLSEHERAEFIKRMGDWFLQEENYRKAANYYRMADDAASFFSAYERVKICCGPPDVFLMLLSFFAREAENILSYNALGALSFAVEMYLNGAGDVFKDIVGMIEPSARESPRLAAGLELVLCPLDECDIEKNAARINRASLLVSDKMPDKLDFLYTSPSILFMYYKKPGSLDDTVKSFNALLDGYRELTGAGDSGAAFLLKAEACYCRGEFGQADAALQAALLNSIRQGDMGVWTAGRFLSARVLLARGDVDGAFKIIDETRGRIASEEGYSLRNTIDLCENFLLLMLDRPEGFVPWIFSEGVYDGRLIRPLVPFAAIVRGACLVKSGRSSEIIGCRLSGAWPLTSFCGVLRSIYDNLTLSTALAEFGSLDESAEFLCGAMDLALPDSLYSPFFEMCPASWGMFEKAAAAGPRYKVFVSKVRACGRRLCGARNMARTDAGILTKREKEVVGLLRNGLKNKEIAGALHVSENTVKSALKNIFRKMGVESRKDIANM